VTTSRRRRTWLPFNSTVISLTSLAISRTDIPSIMEAQLGREIQGYTTQRLIVNIDALSNTTTPSFIACGLIANNAGLALADIDPGANPEADWQWWEGFRVNDVDQELTHIHRDLRVQRRVRGRDTNMFIYVSNEGTITTSVLIHGRVLILEE